MRASPEQAWLKSVWSTSDLEPVWRYVLNVLIGIDITANAILGGTAYQTISCRVGLSIQRGEWASKVPWPTILYNHFIGAVYDTTV